MPSPKNQELGLKSPKRLRGGIDFPSWEGLNSQNDAGAIRDTQLTEVVNARIDGNEIISRGGQEKIHTEPMNGCVYGMIDVPEGATSLMLLANPLDAQIDRYYSETTPTYNNVFNNQIPFGGINPIIIQGVPDEFLDISSSATPRRSLARFGGNLYHFGSVDNGTTFVPSLIKIILPERTSPVSGTSSVSNQAQREAVIGVPEFASWATRMENVDNSTEPSATIKEILYIGSLTTGEVYRWDGSALTTETTNLPLTRHIVVNYADDIWAMSEDKLRKRNGGLWNIEFTFPSASTPHAATDFLGNLIIAKGDSFVVFDGSTFTATIPSFGGDGSTIVTDVKPFGGAVYYAWLDDSSTFLGKWNGSTFNHAVIGDGGESAMSGCLETAGPYLYWTYMKHPALDTAILRQIDINDNSVILDSRTTWPTTLNSVEGPAMDMVAF